MVWWLVQLPSNVMVIGLILVLRKRLCALKKEAVCDCTGDCTLGELFFDLSLKLTNEKLPKATSLISVCH